jgi:outer membrane lipoprotein-sorting protein
MQRMKTAGMLILFFITAYTLQAQEKISAAKILQQAELKRLPWPEMSFYATLTDSGSNNIVNTGYHVFFNNNKTLVVCTAPVAQKGNLVLLQNNEMWFYFKSTSQPAKVTQLQRLSGSVSMVDIARLNWATDYSVDSFKIVKAANETTGELYWLQLQAVSADVSYRKIQLWIDKKTKRPLKADIYLSTEKLYKTLLFTRYGVIEGAEINSELEVIDHFNRDRKSVIHFLQPRREKNLPANYFIKDKLPAVSKEMMAANNN